MAKQNEFGKYILSAGEIATYTVCPKAWSLSQTQPKFIKYKKDINKEHLRNALHNKWLKTLQEAIYYTRSIILLFILLTVTILLFLSNYLTLHHDKL